MTPMAQSIENKAQSRIRGSGERWAFALRDFFWTSATGELSIPPFIGSSARELSGV
jgi:hypothetical protein